MFVPENLTTKRSRDSEASVTKYILGKFAGVTEPAAWAGLSRTRGFNEKASKYHCLPEFQNLEASKQKSLFEVLSFTNLSNWNFK